MKCKEISFSKFSVSAINIWKNDWLLLTAGKINSNFNCMTCSWGSIGYIYDRPVAMVIVLPSRYTYSFLQSNDSFTLSVLPQKYKDRLLYCGNNSGRYVDKVKNCGFTPISSVKVAAPTFEEAELTLECRRFYSEVFIPSKFFTKNVRLNYDNDNHPIMFFGEILYIRGVAKYERKNYPTLPKNKDHR